MHSGLQSLEEEEPSFPLFRFTLLWLPPSLSFYLVTSLDVFSSLFCIESPRTQYHTNKVEIHHYLLLVTINPKMIQKINMYLNIFTSACIGKSTNYSIIRIIAVAIIINIIIIL